MSHSEHEYDVCIIGGGLAGNLQARHLKLNAPSVSVAIVESRTDEEMTRSR